MNQREDLDHILSRLLNRVVAPAPRPGYFDELDDRIAHTPQTGSDEAASRATAQSRRQVGDFPGGHEVGVGIPRDWPSSSILTGVHLTALALVLACDGFEWEAENVAIAVQTYVEVNWVPLRLNVLARYPEAWERHIQHQVYRRWMALDADPQATARASVVALTARAREIAADDREILYYVYFHGFSVNATAIVFDLPPTELARRLREALAGVRHAATPTAPRQPTDESVDRV